MSVDTSGQRQGNSTVDDLDDRKRQSASVKQPFERTWVLGLAYFQGNQWVSVDRTGRLYEPELDPYKLKLVDNRIQPAVLTQVAKMTKSRPVITVVPRSGEDEDVNGALLAERVLDWQWTALGLTAKLRAALMWSRICSKGFWKVCWDPQKGDTTEVWHVTPPGADKPQFLQDASGRPLTSKHTGFDDVIANLAPEVAPTLNKRTIAMGDTAVHVRSPFEIFPHPLTPESGLHEAPWVIEEVVQSKEWVQAQFNVEVEEDAQAVSGVGENRMPGMWSEEPPKTGVVVREFWAPPGSEFPNGKRIVWANGKTLAEKDNEYGWHPYVEFEGTPVPGRYWGTCVTEQSISGQTELNKTLSQLGENAARIGNPPLAKSRQANVTWGGLPGEELLYDDTMQNSLPSFLQVPEMPAYIQNRIPQIVDGLQEQSGQHEISHGAVPTGVTAAAAINLLQEADDTRLGPDILAMEGSLGYAGTKLLQLVARFYTDERTVRISGEDGAWDIFDFKGMMLRDNTDVQVQAGSGMPRSKAAKQAAMQEVLNLALQYGVQLDQRSLRKFFVDYEAGGLERLFGDIDQDERQVQRENRRLSMGEAFAPNEFDNHAFHVDAHNEFRKSARFEQLDQAAQMAFAEHVRLHEQAIQPPPLPQLEGPGGGGPPPQGAPPGMAPTQ